MSINEWVNLLAAVVGMIGILTPYIVSYGRSKSFIERTNKIKKLIDARTELFEMLSQKRNDEVYPSSEYINQIVQNINKELEGLERKQQIGLFITFSTIEVGIFFLLTFGQFSSLLSKRILGSPGQGGYGFWENALEPITSRILIILILTVIAVTITLKLFYYFRSRLTLGYYSENTLLIMFFNIVASLVYVSAWWGLVWIDRLTDWL